MILAYLDTSALFKLIIQEQESSHLERWILDSQAQIITCSLALTELPRAVRRANPDALAEAFSLLKECGIINLDNSLFEHAGRLGLPLLRSLDALHLTAALHLGSQLDVFVGYDARLLEAARQAGLHTRAPV